MMANSVGACDNFVACGNSSVWNAEGTKIGHLDGPSEGMIIFDTKGKIAEMVVV